MQPMLTGLLRVGDVTGPRFRNGRSRLSVEADLGFFSKQLVLLGLLLGKLLHLGHGEAHGLEGEGGELLAHLGVLQRGHHIGADLVAQGGVHALGAEQGDKGVHIQLGRAAGFGDRWYVRHLRDALGSGHGQIADLAAFVDALAGGQAGKALGRVAIGDRGEQLADLAIRHMGHLAAGQIVQPFAAEMTGEEF